MNKSRQVDRQAHPGSPRPITPPTFIPRHITNVECCAHTVRPALDEAGLKAAPNREAATVAETHARAPPGRLEAPRLDRGGLEARHWVRKGLHRRVGVALLTELHVKRTLNVGHR